MPLAVDKTEWASTSVIFLGNFLDGENLVITILLEKKNKALTLLNDYSGKEKLTIKGLQVLAGYLNFLLHAIFTGHAFAQRIYAKYSGAKAKKLKQYHHVSLDKECHFDLEVWRIFLSNHHSRAVCRPMVDLATHLIATDISLVSDASAAKDLGFGAVFGTRWIFAQWEEGYIKPSENQPSIAYLELYALTAALLTWRKLYPRLPCAGLL